MKTEESFGCEKGNGVLMLQIKQNQTDVGLKKTACDVLLLEFIFLSSWLLMLPFYKTQFYKS